MGGGAFQSELELGVGLALLLMHESADEFLVLLVSRLLLLLNAFFEFTGFVVDAVLELPTLRILVRYLCCYLTFIERLSEIIVC